MSSIYSQLVKTEAAKVVAFESLRGATKVDRNTTKEKANEDIFRFGEEAQNLLHCYQPQRILFSETTARNLDALAQYYSRFSESMRRALNPVEADNIYSPFDVGEAMSKGAQQYADYEQTKRMIETEFRKLYGVGEDIERDQNDVG